MGKLAASRFQLPKGHELPQILSLLPQRNKQPRCPSGQIPALKSLADLLESSPHDAPFSTRPNL